MQSTIYLPPAKEFTPENLQALEEFFEKNNILEAWGGNVATRQTLSADTATEVVTDEDGPLDLPEKVMALAQDLSLGLAIHFDATNNTNAIGWNIRSATHWYDPVTKKTHQAPAGCNDATPHFEPEEIQKLLTCSFSGEAFLQSLKPLRVLGILEERPEPSEAEIAAYVGARVETRIYDADNSTSHQEEYAHCYKNGVPNPKNFSRKEILAEMEVAQESLE